MYTFYRAADRREHANGHARTSRIAHLANTITGR